MLEAPQGMIEHISLQFIHWHPHRWGKSYISHISSEPNWLISYSYKAQHQPNVTAKPILHRGLPNTSTWMVFKKDEKELKQWNVDNISLRGGGSRWGCQSVELLPTVPPLGDITWLGELPCTAPSFSPCHIPFVMLTTRESKNTGWLLFLNFLRCTRGVPLCNCLPFILEQRDVLFSACRSACMWVGVCNACQGALSSVSAFFGKCSTVVLPAPIQ